MCSSSGVTLRGRGLQPLPLAPWSASRVCLNSIMIVGVVHWLSLMLVERSPSPVSPQPGSRVVLITLRKKPGKGIWYSVCFICISVNFYTLFTHWLFSTPQDWGSVLLVARTTNMSWVTMGYLSPRWYQKEQPLKRVLWQWETVSSR